MKSFVSKENRKLSKLALNNLEDLSYSAFMKALRKKDVKVNGKRVNKDVMIFIGDKVEIFYAQTDNAKFEEIYKDQNVLVINKFSGYTSESVFEEIKAQYNDAGFIHRLDRNTSGIMIFSLNTTAETELLNGFRNKTFEKFYTAHVVGKMPKKKDGLTAYLVKDKESATVKIFNLQVKNSVLIKTGYEVLEEHDDYSVLLVRLYTGKTHQIRAHLAHIGHSIIGDGKYGDFEANNKFKEKSQKLSATKLILHFEENSPLNYLNNKTFSIKG
ncbi:MAG: RluA family pseudouridine synthase [Clostridia bacterium]|nr:RluA family pseudouridine synthase [Clostridia bacterium]